MKAKLARWGNSVGLRLPKPLVDSVGWEPGSEVEVTAEGSELRIRRRPVPRYRLADLVAEMKRLGPENEPELVDWGPDVGAEIIDDAYSRGEITVEDLLSRNDPSRRR